MIQHRKEGRRFIMGLEEELANKLPGGADVKAFQFFPELCAITNYKSNNENTLHQLNYITFNNTEFYVWCLMKWVS